MDYKNILIIKKKWDKIELDTHKYVLNWNKKTHMGTKSKSTQWHLILTQKIKKTTDWHIARR